MAHNVAKACFLQACVCVFGIHVLQQSIVILQVVWCCCTDQQSTLNTVTVI
jgi:hypothetical protein